MKLWHSVALVIVLGFTIVACGKETPAPPENSDSEPPISVHLTYGTPSDANDNNLNDYLLLKPEFALSYNCSQGTPNWVSWKLDSSWLGNVERQDDFRPDSDLPSGCYKVRPNDYRGSGLDRGHLTPSGDRTNNETMNSATFVMSNMIPQAPENNREVWRELEEYSRELAREGKTLHIVAGGEGSQKTIRDGKITVPLIPNRI